MHLQTWQTLKHDRSRVVRAYRDEKRTEVVNVECHDFRRVVLLIVRDMTDVFRDAEFPQWHQQHHESFLIGGMRAYSILSSG